MRPYASDPESGALDVLPPRSGAGSGASCAAHEPALGLERMDWLLIALITLLGMAMNLGKPLTVDDAPHLIHAIHMATHPLSHFTYQYTLDYWPEFGLSTSAPPVASGYLALGVKLLGDDPVLLKLWVSPWLFLLSWMSMRLMKPWAGKWALAGVGGVLLGPVFLPAMNLMIDLPAITLAVTGVTLMRDHLSRGSGARGFSWCLALGLAAGAMAPLAKYPGASGPIMMFVLCLLYRRWALAGAVAAATAGLFGCWEGFVYSVYHHTHIGYQLAVAPRDPMVGVMAVALMVLTANAAPMFLAMAGAAAGVRSRAALLGLWSVGLGAYLLLAFMAVPAWVYMALSAAEWGLTAWCAGRLLKGVRASDQTQGWLASEDAKVDLFLVAWMALELALQLAISPFPAYRRMMGCLLAGGFLLARAGYRRQKDPVPMLTPALLAGSLMASMLFWYADRAFAAATPNALAEFKEFTDHPPSEILRLRAAAGDPSPTGGKRYVYGRWCVPYYAPRMGLEELVLDQTVLEPGDRVMMSVCGTYVPGTELEPGAFRLEGRLNLASDVPVDPTTSYWGSTGMTHATGRGVEVVFLTVLKQTVILSNLPVGELESTVLRRTIAPSPLAAWVIVESAMRNDKPFDNLASRRMVEWGEPFVLRALDHPAPGPRLWCVMLVEKNPSLATDAVKTKLKSMTGDQDAQVRAAAARVLAPPG
jgi:hypothetical protein